MKLLGVPQLLKGIGKIIAEAIYDLLNDLSNRIQFMCFDTTASNTGVKSGACVLLEIKLERVNWPTRYMDQPNLQGIIFSVFK